MKPRHTTKSGLPCFSAVYFWEMDLPAYRHLSVYGRALLIEFRRKYNGSNNGFIAMSARDAAGLLGCDKDTAHKYLGELEEKGWIREAQKGSLHRKSDAGGRKFRAATTWRITNQPIDLGVGTKETREYRDWKP